MKTATMHRAWIALALLLTAGTNVSAQELNWAQKMFEKQKHDFGAVARGSDARYRLKLTNIYKQTVHIANVRTTCGCSAAKPSKDLLPSGDSAYIEISMNTLRFSRRKDSNVVVTFDRPVFQEVRIPITAYIRTDVVLTPGKVNFGAVDQGKPAQRKVSIAYAGRADWTIREVRGGGEHVKTEVVETTRQNGRVNYDLVVTLQPTAPVGGVRQQLILITDDANSSQIPVLIEARVESDITVTPAVVSFGLLTAGQKKTVNVVVRGRKPFAIEKIECDSERRCFTVRLPKSARQVHVLPLTVTPPAEAGKFSEEFTVTIAGRPEPVVFRAYGTIGQ